MKPKAPKPENHLYYGDNLTRMQQMGKHSVDLIYLDPPFNSKQNYNLIYKNMTGKPVPDQADAFCDTWEMDAEKEELAKTMPILMREHGVEDYYVQFWALWIKALRQTAALAGLSDLYGTAFIAYEKHPAPYRLDLSALRPDR